MAKARWSWTGICSSILLPILLLAACAPAAGGELNAAPGQEITLSPGQTVIITGEDLSLTFQAVTGDSRCPQGVACIWAGEAKCQMTVTLKGAASDTLFTVSGGSDGYSRSTFGGYRASFKLSPYPAAGKTIAASDYRLRLSVEKTGPA